MNILRLGETEHGADFCVLREHGYGHYLLLLVETLALFETDGTWIKTEAETAFLFRPGQRHSYRAQAEKYTDCWLHAESAAPLLFESFPFGKPIPLRSAAKNFYRLFRILRDEFFAERRTRDSVCDLLASALIEMLAGEIEVRGPLFSRFLSLREEIVRQPAAAWSVKDAAKRINVSEGYFHVLYKKYFRTTFVSDVVSARIQSAEELLVSTPDSVERIAERCGYTNTEHFIRQFREATGSTPLRYKKDILGYR